jgi:hypothetical protein
VLHPPTPTTRFSSDFLGNPKLNLRSHRAQRRFVRHTLAAVENEPGDVAPQSLQARTSIRIPRGTVLKFDEELLEALVTTGELPDRTSDHLVLTVQPPGTEEDASEYYSFSELKTALEHLSADDRRLVTQSVNGARLLLAPLILQRHPFIGYPPWLDDGVDAPVRPSSNP